MSLNSFKYNQPFPLECGKTLPGVEIAYHTYGQLNDSRDNVVWVCHALTANSDPMDWWPGLMGEGKLFDPNKYFIICANILGSCYGSSGPLSIDPKSGKPFYAGFPMVTIRDMVKAHILLREHLELAKIEVCIGGSMGGYQVLEWSIIEPEVIQNQILLVTSAAESAWGKAVHAAQRLSIEADPSWKDDRPDAGWNGLKAARAIGMLTYRTYQAFESTQSDEYDGIENFKAASYINYQGEKLARRFNVYTYWLLTKAMDSHNIARGRGNLEEVLKGINVPTLIIGIIGDQLCPTQEQKLLAKYIPEAVYSEIDSLFGHDGFLIEYEQIDPVIRRFLH